MFSADAPIGQDEHTTLTTPERRVFLPHDLQLRQTTVLFAHEALRVVVAVRHCQSLRLVAALLARGAFAGLGVFHFPTFFVNESGQIVYVL